MTALTPLRVPLGDVKRLGLMGPDVVVVVASACPPGSPFDLVVVVVHPRYADLPVRRATHTPLPMRLETVLAWKRAAVMQAQAEVAA